MSVHYLSKASCDCRHVKVPNHHHLRYSATLSYDAEVCAIAGIITASIWHQKDASICAYETSVA